MMKRAEELLEEFKRSREQMTPKERIAAYHAFNDALAASAKDLFICPGCNDTSPIEGAPASIRFVARDVRCKCGRRFNVLVNQGCRVLNYQEIRAR